MSKGPGRVQRVISDLIAAEPGGAWTTDDICRRVYFGVNSTQKKHRVAVLRALRNMKLPDGSWSFEIVGPGGEYCLFDRCNVESRTRLAYIEYLAKGRLYGWICDGYEDWRLQNACAINKAAKAALDSRTYRDATPLEKLDIQINTERLLAAFTGKYAQLEELAARRDSLLGETI